VIDNCQHLLICSLWTQDSGDQDIQGEPKKLHTAFFAITLPTLNQFS